MSIPLHVGLIPDGNRRWCHAENMSYRSGYMLSFGHLLDHINFMFEHGTKEVSVYLLSRSNLTRSQEDLEAVFDALLWSLQDGWGTLANTVGAKIVHAGELIDLPVPVQTAIKVVVDNSKQERHSKKRINLLINYDPAEELKKAFISSHTDFHRFMYVDSGVDLVIRTAGVALLSNFLPLQSAYALIWVTDKFYPEVTCSDIENAFEFFARVKRPFGA